MELPSESRLAEWIADSDWLPHRHLASCHPELLSGDLGTDPAAPHPTEQKKGEEETRGVIQLLSMGKDMEGRGLALFRRITSLCLLHGHGSARGPMSPDTKKLFYVISHEALSRCRHSSGVKLQSPVPVKHEQARCSRLPPGRGALEGLQLLRCRGRRWSALLPPLLLLAKREDSVWSRRSGREIRGGEQRPEVALSALSPCMTRVEGACQLPEQAEQEEPSTQLAESLTLRDSSPP
ncbi:hypothetical protein TREES_T100020505 [Tupaia chinensis]|uniref:Uncharacterized protein n=1 Tax=Tupaia chinensis TaxID=246437 RepID=L9L0W6_TUPCH|nr:hypothetical protein TREES_T100020505 [Tupaia chinensis]